MRVDLRPPPGYEPLPPVVSETTAKFRWPVGNPRTPYYPPKGQISVDGPLQSPPLKPRLRYHRQSSYTDAYIKFPTVSDRASKPKSEWSTPIGKHGPFSGESMHEKEYRWPPKTVQAERFPPMISTVGLGILPIIDRMEKHGLNAVSRTTSEDMSCDDDKKGSTSTVSSSPSSLTKPSYWVLNCNPHKPVERIWDEQTTHRVDYTVPPKITGYAEETVPRTDESHFQFIGTGNMETASTSMRDYRLSDAAVCQKPSHEDFLSGNDTFETEEDKHSTCHCHEDNTKANYA